MASEGARLALIVDDMHALRALAAWSMAGIPMADASTDHAAQRIGLLAGITTPQARVILDRLIAVGCLRDGDISELADKLLQQRVLTPAKARKSR